MPTDTGLVHARDIYNTQLYIILRDRMGKGGWPPRDVSKVACWTVVDLVAKTFSKSAREVAADLIELHLHHGDPST